MLKIKGFIFPPNKNIFSSLISIYGVGFFRANYICKSLNINFYKKNKFLSNLEIKNISDKLNSFKIGENLKKEVKDSVKKLINIRCYRGIRHLKKLPVRGQNTKNNSRTRKGPKKSIFIKKFLNIKNVNKKKKSKKK